MPAKSKAQQRLMAAAEHGANFPMAQKVRASMTMSKMHDFAAGSMKGKPTHVKHDMHPTMHQRAQMVKEAHAHLGQEIAGFHQLPARQRMMAAQHHVNLRMGKAK